MGKARLDVAIEAVLFSASEPLSLKTLSQLMQHTEGDVSAALTTIKGRLRGGICLAETGDTFRLVTAPEASAAVRNFLQDSSHQDLSKPALETLAIVAYRGPLTRHQIEEIRGVSSEVMIRNLLARDLIIEAGRTREPGRPQQYAISHTFLQHFGLTSSSDLPPLPELVHEN